MQFDLNAVFPSARRLQAHQVPLLLTSDYRRFPLPGERSALAAWLDPAFILTDDL